MQYHEGGVTSTHFHQEYPLMASASNDGTIHVFHFKVDNQTLSDAVILPLKVLRGHTKKGTEGVKMVKFHPKQPWVFSTGCDHKVILWT
jgi:ribosome biogenesis protein ERB1